MKDKVLAVDIGTSSVRVIIVDVNGRILHKEQMSYDVIIVNQYMQEQDPDILCNTVFKTIKNCMINSKVDQKSIKGIGFSCQMYNIFPIDHDGNKLFNMILWSDSRSEEQAERLQMIYGKRYLYETTGCPMNSLFPISKIMWLREKKESIYNKAHKFISIKAYILNKLVGKYVIDYSMASATGLFNIHDLKWDQKALSVIGLSEDKLSIPISGTEVLEVCNDELLNDLGLPKDIELISGGGDGPLANIGSGAYEEGIINVDLGTSGAARVITKKPLIDIDERLWSFAVTREHWAYGGILSNVGNGYKWLIRNIAEFACTQSEKDFFQIVESELKLLPSAVNDLIFIPYLLKARSPYWDDKTKATIYGLTHAHTFVDMVKAYMESIGYNLFSLINIINEQIKVVPYIILTGGLASSEYLGQLLADILGKTVVTLKSNEGSIMGAAIMTLYATGLIDTLTIEGINEKKMNFKPKMSMHIEYQKKYVKYLKLRTAIRSLEL